MSAPLLQLINVGFQTDQFTALENIDWVIDSDDYYQIIGANASGKTTLLNLIAGVRQPTSGTILWRGEPVVFHTPQEAYRHDIILMQDIPQLFHQGTVVENVVTVVDACKPSAGLFRLPRRELDVCRQLFRDLGIDIDPEETVSNLNLFQQRLLELAKIYYRGAALILMDSLSGWCSIEELKAIAKLLQAIREKHGCAVILCASNVQHIIPECRSILYLKSGRAVGCVHRDSHDMLQIPEEFRSTHLAYPKLDLVTKEKILELKDFELPVLSDSPYALPGDLVLHAGEILGVYGMDLPHCQALCDMFTGQRQDYRGQILVKGLPVRIQSPKHALRLGIGCQPLLKEDALFPCLELWMNMMPPVLVQGSDFNRPFPQYLRIVSRYYASRVHITPPEPRQHCRYFSSANQQKMLLCRYNYQKARIFVLFNPTSGMDNQSKLDIYNLFTHLQRRGCGIVLFSNDLDELAYMCDKIHVAHTSCSNVISGTSQQRAQQLYSSIRQLRR